MAFLTAAAPFMSALAPLAGGLLGGIFGGGNQQNAAAGQLYNQAAAGYGGLVNTAEPFVGSSLGMLNRFAKTGFDPQTYSAGMQRAIGATDQNIAAARNAIGSQMPNFKAASGDMLNSGILGEAGVSAQLAGENEMFKAQNASELAQLSSSDVQAGSAGLANIGNTYMQAAQQSGNPFMNALNFMSGMGPGGATGASGGSSWMDMLMNAFGGKVGGASPSNPMNVLPPPQWTGGSGLIPAPIWGSGGGGGWSPGSTTPPGSMALWGGGVTGGP